MTINAQKPVGRASEEFQYHLLEVPGSFVLWIVVIVVCFASLLVVPPVMPCILVYSVWVGKEHTRLDMGGVMIRRVAMLGDFGKVVLKLVSFGEARPSLTHTS